MPSLSRVLVGFGLFVSASSLVVASSVLDDRAHEHWGIPRNAHFPLHARGTNKDGSMPTYKNPNAAIEDRIADLLPRMTIEEKVAQLIQGDIGGWMNMTDPLDDTLVFNATGLVDSLATKAGSIWAGYLTPWNKLVFAIQTAQDYLMHNTTLGIPALVDSEGLHGFTDNGTTWPSPLGLAASWNTDLLQKAAASISDEAEGLGITHIFAPVLDLSRELRWGRVEENYGEDPFLTGEMGHAYVSGIQSGTRRNVSHTATARMAATCKHFAAFGSPEGGLNIAPVHGGERELRTMYLPPFKRACVDALTIMTAYSSYDGIPAIANSHLQVDILRNEWGYKHYVTADAGSVDMLYDLHFVAPDRATSAKIVVENISGEMGGGTYTFLTLPDSVRNGTVDVKYVDDTVATILRIKFMMGLFENPYPYADYNATLRTSATRALLHQMEREQIVLLENRNGTLPLSKTSPLRLALIGPQADRVSFGDYVFFNASHNGISPLAGLRRLLANDSSVELAYAEGCELWSDDRGGFADAVDAARGADVAVVVVGTWSLDQTLLWTPGTNATTGEHVDLSDLGLVGAQRALVQAVKGTGKPTVVVFVSGKPLAEPWIQENADAVVQQFYPGELGGLALAEVLFGDANPSGKLPVSFPRDVGTTPIFYNYLKAARPLDPGRITDNGTLAFGHQYVLDSPAPLWGFGHGLSYTTFNYTGLTLSKSTIGTNEDFDVTVTVHNTGKVDGKEVVQVYMTDVISSTVTPVQQLVGFAKVDVKAGGSETVRIPVKSEQLAVWTVNNKWAVEPGAFIIKVGNALETFANATLIVA